MKTHTIGDARVGQCVGLVFIGDTEPGTILCECKAASDELADLNARRLADCWNDHDMLVSALRESVEFLGRVNSHGTNSTTFQRLNGILERAAGCKYTMQDGKLLPVR